MRDAAWYVPVMEEQELLPARGERGKWMGVLLLLHFPEEECLPPLRKCVVAAACLHAFAVHKRGSNRNLTRTAWGPTSKFLLPAIPNARDVPSLCSAMSGCF